MLWKDITEFVIEQMSASTNCPSHMGWVSLQMGYLGVGSVYGSQISDFDIWIQTPGDFEEFSLSCSHLGPSVKAPRRRYGLDCFILLFYSKHMV